MASPLTARLIMLGYYAYTTVFPLVLIAAIARALPRYPLYRR